MLNHTQIEQDRNIKSWLEDRQQLLSLYNDVAGTNPFQDELIINQEELLQTFCEHLIDYISLGHFKIYELLIKKQVNVTSRFSPIMQQIFKTTNFINKFNKRYTNPNSLNNLKNDLSNLGEILAIRLDLEDKLMPQKKLLN